MARNNITEIRKRKVHIKGPKRENFLSPQTIYEILVDAFPRVDPACAVYLKGIMEFMTVEILEQAELSAREREAKTITIEDMNNALKDEELIKAFIIEDDDE